MIKRYLKILGKIVLVIFLAFLILLWRACFWYPYRIEKYINPELEKINVSKRVILKSEKFDKYKVNGAFVEIFLRGHNQTSESGNSPYKIYLSIWGKDDTYKTAYINKFKILLNGKKKYILQNNLLQIELLFRHASNSSKMTIASFRIPDLIDLDFKNKEEIEIITEIEVVTEEKTEKKEMRYKFIPVLEEGHTGLLERL